MSMSPRVIPVVVACDQPRQSLETRPAMELAPDDLIEMAPLIRRIAAQTTPMSASLVVAKQLLTTPTQEDGADTASLVGLLSFLRDFTRQVS